VIHRIDSKKEQVMRSEFSEKLEDRQKFHNMHEAFSEKAYNTPGLLPDRYVLNLTNLCNLKCSFCFQKKEYTKGVMTKDDWLRLIEQLPDYARVTLTGGEPLLFKEFKSVFSAVAKRFPCNIISNGVILSKGIIDYLLSFPQFRVLSLSIDDIGNKNRAFTSEQWEHVVEMMQYFLKKSKEISSPCFLDIKTTILDQNADDIFRIHKFLNEDIGVDTNVFQFLKGSPIQHADYMVDFEDICSISRADYYQKFDTIKEQLDAVRKYSLLNGKATFLHPKFGYLTSEKVLCELDVLNEVNHNSENYEQCKFPWSSVHINFDGILYPCLAVSMGNVRETSLQDIVNGKRMSKFRKLIRKEGTVQACNRCGWIRLRK
jgi:MoaA/NifB/PqqE/SkfB family radical SAM enzyme